jgi:hypothetical protein
MLVSIFSRAAPTSYEQIRYFYVASRVIKLTSFTLFNNTTDQWFQTCGTRTPGVTRRTGWGYAKIILVMAENTKKKKGVKIKHVWSCR